jgi:hypothetical protein
MNLLHLKTTLLILFLSLSTFGLSQNAYHDAYFHIENKKAVRDAHGMFKKYIAINENAKVKLSEGDRKSLVKQFETLANALDFYQSPYIDSVSVPSVKSLKEILTAKDSIALKLKTFFEARAEKSMEMMNTKSLGLKEYNFVQGALRSSNGASLTSVPSTSLLSATSIIDGTALFLKKRIKQEFQLAFLNQFKQKIGENTLLQQLMPETFQTLQSVLSMDNQIGSLNSIAMAAFQSDLEQMPDHIETAMLQNDYFSDIKTEIPFKYYALPFNFLKHFRLGTHPAFAMRDLRNEYFNGDSDLDRIVKTMVALNDNFVDKESDWRESSSDQTGEAAGNLFDSKTVFVESQKWYDLKRKGGEDLFMAIIYKRRGKELFPHINPKSTDSLLKKKLRIIGDNMGEYLSNLNAFERLYQNIQVSEGRGLRDSLALDLTWNVMQLVDKSHLIYFGTLDSAEQVTKKSSYWGQFKPLSEATLKAVGSLQRKNYAGVVLNTFQILRGLSNMPRFKSEFLKNDPKLNDFFFYANFMTDVLSANNSEEVGDILDRYAAPVGSYGIKRRSKMSISLNAYPGLFVAAEHPWFTDSRVKEWGFISGVTAPIGLSFDWGGYGLEGKPKSWSLFVSAIDIGAVLSYRWTNDVVSGLPDKIEWAQVLSPGLYLGYGLANLPLNMSFGYQISPKLRNVSDNGNTSVRNQTFGRFSLNLTADIVIFNFHKKKK